MSDLTLAEYAHYMWRSAGIKPEPEDEGDACILLAGYALRLGCGPRTMADLARDPAAKAWIGASKLLEHERAQRRAFALTQPGVRLEAALSAEPETPDLTDAIAQAFAETDKRIR